MKLHLNDAEGTTRTVGLQSLLVEMLLLFLFILLCSMPRFRRKEEKEAWTDRVKCQQRQESMESRVKSRLICAVCAQSVSPF